jgi:hypothetical protein
MNIPNFYLATSEGYDLGEPRKVYILKKLRVNHREDCLLVNIKPSIIGQKYGLGRKDISYVVLASHYEGDTLLNINKYPMDVYVARPLNDTIFNSDVLRDDDIELIAWAEIYRTEEDARKR